MPTCESAGTVRRPRAANLTAKVLLVDGRRTCKLPHGTLAQHHLSSQAASVVDRPNGVRLDGLFRECSVVLFDPFLRGLIAPYGREQRLGGSRLTGQALAIARHRRARR